jgi:hypothetical protein
MKALCMVAHPDDCVIFGYHYIMEHSDWDWNICYLTYNLPHERAIEMKNFWTYRGIETNFGGFIDDWKSVKNGEIGFNDIDAKKFIDYHCYKADTILTHNHFGEYGHPHHLFINQAVQHINVPKVYFGHHPEYGSYAIHGNPSYDLSELPIHRDIINGFDLTISQYHTIPELKLNV